MLPQVHKQHRTTVWSVNYNFTEPLWPRSISHTRTCFKGDEASQ